MKKLLLLSILMLLPMLASADDGDTFSEETVEGVTLTYTVISESEKTCMVGDKYYPAIPTARAARIRRGPEEEICQASGDITIPGEANGYRVVRIESFAFHQAAITSVFIPNSVETIGIAAFRGCADLKNVRLPEHLKVLEEEAFSGCTNLTSINIPEGVTSIGDDAFANCIQLNEITIPSSVEHFGDAVFKITGFTSLPKLPESLTTIPNGMFYECYQLTSIEIPKNITSIGAYAFGRCPISEIEIPASVTYIGEATFAKCKNLTSITIPNNVTDIGMNAFLGCSNMKTVTLSNNISGIREGCFKECTNLESVIIPNGVKFIDKWAFASCSSLSSIDIPETVEEIGEQAFTNCSSLTQLFIPKSVVNFKINKDDNWWQYSYRTFIYGCNSLKSLVVDEDNPVYDSRNNCNAIIETASNTLVAGCVATTIPESITTIGLHAFDDFQDLTSITLPRSLKNIELRAFYRTGFHEISIPKNVTFIGDYAFSMCDSLKDLYCYAKNVPETEYTAFCHLNIWEITLHVPAASISAYQAVEPWKNFKEIVAVTDQEDDYRPFIEDGKVWAVKVFADGMPTRQWIDYYYFDGDTIVNGHIAKRMLVASEQDTSGKYVGAWYEQDKKVYFAYDQQQFELLYDFTLSSGDTIYEDEYMMYVVNKMSGGIPGFKGMYYVFLYNSDVMNRWLEGVGSESYPYINTMWGLVGRTGVLLVCKVGDEIIYYNSEEEDPYSMEAKKHRFDFTHTIKTKPKAPSKREKSDARINSSEREVARPKVKARTREDNAETLYGEYNNLLLGINLEPLDEAYLVRITNESDQVVYEKTINAGSIVGLNIDISAFAKGRYTVTMENSSEVFTGEFETNTTGIQELKNSRIEGLKSIYNLQGQRLNRLQKGLNIVNGRKVFVQ
ncbi:MAG: leucine-rich repeat protein [Prevotella sp.]|nr:leucine-rich repeat protein [Prevotella sp.]